MNKNIKSFVTFRLPNENNFFTLATAQSLINRKEIDFTKNGFYISSFDKEKNYILEPEITLENEFISCYFNLNNSPTEITKEEYLPQVKKITEAIKRTEYEKVVLSRVKLIKKTENFDYKKVFLSLCKKYPTAFISMFYSVETGFWIGASPELLLKKGNKTYHTVSLAGTKTSNKNWTEKEIHEQQCVTDYIEKCLKNTAKNIQITKPFDAKAGNLIHLKSELNFELNSDNEVGKIINKLHPTPAVCGIPKEKAKNFIQEIEKHNRDFYTGFIGLKSENSLNLFVNLRCMQVCKNNLALYIGGGIMENSIPEDEWEETENKSKTILNSFN